MRAYFMLVGASERDRVHSTRSYKRVKYVTLFKGKRIAGSSSSFRPSINLFRFPLLLHLH